MPVDFLARIADDSRRRVEGLKLSSPVHALRQRLVTHPPGRLERALRRGGANGDIKLLCEIKRASPSRGELNSAVDPVAMAQLYERGGATAVSLVTEPSHFRGDPAWVDAVRPKVSIPILMKDFVLDSYQIVDAAARGADGVLLLAALLSEVQMGRFINEARLVGLDALVEVHDAAQLQQAIGAGATLVGINNRDLHTFEVRLETSIELLPQLPPWITAVAESGLSTPEDLARLRSTRCDAVLIGEAFMLSDDPASSLERLRAAARG